MASLKQNWSGEGVGRICKINNVVTMLNDMKDFGSLDLKCSGMFCFTSIFSRICLNMRPSSWPSQVVKN